MISKKYYTHTLLCSVLILILIGTYFYTMYKESFQNSNVETSVIPLKIFQTYETKDVPEEVHNMINKMKSDNPEFEYYLFDNDERRQFIQEHFDKDVVDAYDSIVPGAYRADLWRYCVLYIHGGIYIDIKLRNVDGFKLISLTDKEYFVRDMDVSGRGILNGFIVAKPGNKVLMKAIRLIVYNVQNKVYGNHCLYPTGPHLFKEILSADEISDCELYLITDQDNNLYIDNGKRHIITWDKTAYNSYKKKNKLYVDHWREKTVYK